MQHPLILFGTLALLGFSFNGCTVRHLPTKHLHHKEPSYCHPNNFDQNELKLSQDPGELEKNGLVRAHLFRVGRVVLVGAGVGNSQSIYLKELALLLSRQEKATHAELEQRLKQFNPLSLKASQKLYPATHAKALEAKHFCTWYLNHPRKKPDPLRDEAALSFNQEDILHSPVDLNPEQAKIELMYHFKNLIRGNPALNRTLQFLECASEEHYLALGCNEMMHRGPTLFGMLLAFSGCSPEHALEIANQTWSLNSVKRLVRLSAIQSAFDWGQEETQLSLTLQSLFGGPGL